jgi:hypothetical protein
VRETFLHSYAKGGEEENKRTILLWNRSSPSLTIPRTPTHRLERIRRSGFTHRPRDCSASKRNTKKDAKG